MSAVLAGDLTPAGQRAVTGPVGQRPVPRLPLKLPARTTMTGWALITPARSRMAGRRTPCGRIASIPMRSLGPRLSWLLATAACCTTADLAHE